MESPLADDGVSHFLQLRIDRTQTLSYYLNAIRAEGHVRLVRRRGRGSPLGQQSVRETGSLGIGHRIGLIQDADQCSVGFVKERPGL